MHDASCLNALDLQFHMVQATYRVKEARKQLYSENGRHPSDEEIAEAAGLSMKRLSAVLLTPKAPRSLDQKIGLNMDLKPSVSLLFPFIMHFQCQNLNCIFEFLSFV